MAVSNKVYHAAVLSSEERTCWVEAWVGSQSCLLDGKGKKDPHGPSWNVNPGFPERIQSLHWSTTVLNTGRQAMLVVTRVLAMILGFLFVYKWYLIPSTLLGHKYLRIFHSLRHLEASVIPQFVGPSTHPLLRSQSRNWALPQRILVACEVHRQKVVAGLQGQVTPGFFRNRFIDLKWCAFFLQEQWLTFQS
jgi:hypothetical protein